MPPTLPPDRRPVPRRAGRIGVARGVCWVVLALVASACMPDGEPPVSDVVVGAGPSAESMVLAEVVAALAREGGLTASVVTLADDDDARRALEVGDVDVLPSYTGEAWLRVLGRGDPPSDPGTSLARVREFDELEGLRWLQPAVSREEGLEQPPADVTFAFVVQVEADEGEAPAADVSTLSELAGLLTRIPDPVLCVDPAFRDREDGLAVVLGAYSIDPASLTVLDATPADAVVGVASGTCVAGLTSATDGRAWLAGQRPLLDDLGVFPAFVVAPVVRDDALVREPGLEELLRPLLTGLTTRRLGEWNARVVAGEDPADVGAAAVVELTGG